MTDRKKYGKHLREVVDQVRALPLYEQRSQAVRSGDKQERQAQTPNAANEAPRPTDETPHPADKPERS